MGNCKPDQYEAQYVRSKLREEAQFPRGVSGSLSLPGTPGADGRECPCQRAACTSQWRTYMSIEIMFEFIIDASDSGAQGGNGNSTISPQLRTLCTKLYCCSLVSP